MPDYERGYEREEVITSRPKVSIRHEPVEEIYVEHRKSTERRRPSTPYFEEERYERYESDSDPGSKSTSSRRRKSVDIKTVEKTKHKACGPLCKDHPNHPSKSIKQESDSDSDYDSEEYEREKRAARKKKLLAAGLATVTTIAAINGAVNHTKAARERRKALENGEICSSEYELLKTKSRARDAFSLGVVAVGINNVHNAWKKHHSQRQEHMKAVVKHEEKRKKKLEKQFGGGDIEEIDIRKTTGRKVIGGAEGMPRRRSLQETAYEETYREREAWSGRSGSVGGRDDRYLR